MRMEARGVRGGPAAVTPEEYIASLDEPRRGEVRELHRLILDAAPKLEPYMESGMIGYGRFHYRYASGREGDTCRLGLASRKQYISLYVNAEDEERQDYLARSYRERLPGADVGKGCVRIKKLGAVDRRVLREMVREAALRHEEGSYPRGP